MAAALEGGTRMHTLVLRSVLLWIQTDMLGQILLRRQRHWFIFGCRYRQRYRWTYTCLFSNLIWNRLIGAHIQTFIRVYAIIHTTHTSIHTYIPPPPLPLTNLHTHTTETPNQTQEILPHIIFSSRILAISARTVGRVWQQLLVGMPWTLASMGGAEGPAEKVRSLSWPGWPWLRLGREEKGKEREKTKIRKVFIINFYIDI